MKQELQNALKILGIKELLPIQELSIPAINDGKNVLIQAATGSGKTLCYLLPALERTDRHELHTKVLVITPTRELALQVSETCEKLTAKTGHHVITLIGGMDIRRQINALKNRPQILIGTPGRIRDLLEAEIISLSELSLLVFDEADEIFSTGQTKEAEYIIEKTDHVQTVCLSATITDHVRSLFKEGFTMISLNETSSVNEQITSYYIHTDNKRKTLLHLLDTLPITSCIVFSNYKNDVNDIHEMLQRRKILSAPFSSYYEEKERIRILKDFKKGKIRVLCATDAAARGLDITGVSHIIHYDIPNDIETWIHRSGRSAHQLNTSGISISLLKDEDNEVSAYILEHAEEYNDVNEGKNLRVPLRKKKEAESDITKIRISGGRKDKLRPKDIIGALCTIFAFEEIGTLEIQDTCSYVTILKKTEVPERITIKGKKRKIELQ